MSNRDEDLRAISDLYEKRHEGKQLSSTAKSIKTGLGVAGLAGTAGILGYGAYRMGSGSGGGNFLGLRVYAQAATLGLLAFGALASEVYRRFE